MKVKIEIRDKQEDGTYCAFSTDSIDGKFKEGDRYISVRMSANRYGSSSPCLTDEEITNSVKNAEEWIKKEGDIPEVVDLREKSGLIRWM